MSVTNSKVLGGGLLLAALAGPAVAQGSDPALVNQLLQRIDQLQRRLDALEAAQGRARGPADGQAVRQASERAAAAERSAADARAAAAAARRDAAAAQRDAAAGRAGPAAQAGVATVAARPVPMVEAGAPMGPLPAQGPGAPPPNTPQAVTLGTLAGSIRIPGTDTSLRLYGFAAGIARTDFSPRNPADVITAQSIPLEPSVAERQRGEFRIDGRRSRFGFETTTSTAWGPFRTLVEMDFAGSQSTASLTTQATVSNFIPRLRHAYGELGPILAGQTWTLLFEANQPQRFDFSIPLSQSAGRLGQFRYTHRFGPQWTLAGSINSPYSDATLTNGARFDDSDALVAPNAAFTPVSRTPDLMTLLRWEDPKLGHVGLAGVVRPTIGITNDGSATPAQRFERSAVGWGLSVTGSAHVGALDRAYLRFSYGEGIGRHLGSASNGQGVVSNALLPGVSSGQVRIDTVPVIAASVGYTHFWTPEIRTNLSMAWASLTYPDYVQRFDNAGRAQLNRDIGAGHANLIWSPVPRVDLGLEYVGSTRTLETPLLAGVGGESARGAVSHRLLVGSQFRF